MQQSLVKEIYTQKGRHIAFGPEKRVYNLGCGNQTYPHVIGVDRLGTSRAHIQCDLDTFPWPIESDSADYIISFQTFEHLDNLPRVMEEVYRIAKHGARIVIEVPYFRSVGAFQDPTHRHFFTTRTMDYFSQQTVLGGYRYANVNFVMRGFWLGWPTPSKNPITRAVKALAHAFPDWYDRYLSLILPVHIIVYELEVMK